MIRAGRVVVLAAVLAVAGACGDDGGGGNDPDAMVDAPIDTPIDTPSEVTFTAFVIDLVQNQTINSTDPKAYSEFSALDDPDLNNPAAYAVLFN